MDEMKRHPYHETRRFWLSAGERSLIPNCFHILQPFYNKVFPCMMICTALTLAEKYYSDADYLGSRLFGGSLMKW